MKKIFLSIIFSTILLPLFSQVDFTALDSTVFCKGDTITFLLTGQQDTVEQVIWTFGDSTVANTDTITHFVFDDTGTYTISAIVLFSDSTSDTIIKPDYITIKDTTGINFLIDNENLLSSQYFFIATDTNGIFNWDIDGQLFEDTTYRFFYSFQDYGDKQITLIQKIAYNCVVSVTKTVKVESILKAPNIFTPNNDGINDYFEIKTDGINTYTLFIFNRYGEIVYSITSKRPYWDGRTATGIEMINGIYYYILENTTNSSEVLKGFVYLIR